MVQFFWSVLVIYGIVLALVCALQHRRAAEKGKVVEDELPVLVMLCLNTLSTAMQFAAIFKMK